MANDNTGNVEQSAPEVDLTKEDISPTPVDTEESSAFFQALEDSVNGISSETTAANPDNRSSVNTQNDERPVEAQANYEAEAENLSKRYADSSREAKRLNNRLGELEPYLPILDAMKQDPNLVSHVKGYFEGGGSAPSSMKEKLGLDDDFIFYPDDAFSNPKSDSSQLMGATIDGIVQRRLAQANQKMQQDNVRLSEEAKFKQEHDMSDEKWQEFQSFAKNRSLKLEDIYYLMNREGRDQKIAQEAGRQVQEQVRNVQNRPNSLATSGNVPVQDVSPDDKVFDALLGVDGNFNPLAG